MLSALSAVLHLPNKSESFLFLFLSVNRGSPFLIALAGVTVPLTKGHFVVVLNF